MSAASSASRATTPTNQPSQVGECPGAPERPVRLTVNTGTPEGYRLDFTDPREVPGTPKKKARKDSMEKKALEPIVTKLDFGSM